MLRDCEFESGYRVRNLQTSAGPALARQEEVHGKQGYGYPGGQCKPTPGQSYQT